MADTGTSGEYRSAHINEISQKKLYFADNYYAFLKKHEGYLVNYNISNMLRKPSDSANPGMFIVVLNYLTLIKNFYAVCYSLA